MYGCRSFLLNMGLALLSAACLRQTSYRTVRSTHRLSYFPPLLLLFLPISLPLLALPTSCRQSQEATRVFPTQDLSGSQKTVHSSSMVMLLAGMFFLGQRHEPHRQALAWWSTFETTSCWRMWDVRVLGQGFWIPQRYHMGSCALQQKWKDIPATPITTCGIYRFMTSK